MVNLDLSKFLPEEPYNYLAPFLPGGFFEVSILLANPDLVSQTVAKPQQNFAIGHYMMLGIALFLAFAIGNGFILLVTLIQYFFAHLFRFCVFLWKHLCKWSLQPLSAWLLKKTSGKRQWIFRFNRYAMETGSEGSEEWKKPAVCWKIFAWQLLKMRYGIAPEHINEDVWEVLYWTLGTPTREERRGSMMMIASHATGWSGLAAALIAPVLVNRYYLSFCAFMILNGLLHDYYVIVQRLDTRVAGYLNVRAVLREFQKTSAKEGHSQTTDPESGKSKAR